MSLLRCRLCCSKPCGSETESGWLFLPNPDHSALDRSFQQLGCIGNSQLFHHIGAMRLDGFDADLEPLTDLLVFESSPDQLEDLLLPAGQGFRAFFPWGRSQVDEGRSGFGLARSCHVCRSPLNEREFRYNFTARENTGEQTLVPNGEIIGGQFGPCKSKLYGPSATT